MIKNLVALVALIALFAAIWFPFTRAEFHARDMDHHGLQAQASADSVRTFRKHLNRYTQVFLAARKDLPFSFWESQLDTIDREIRELEKELEEISALRPEEKETQTKRLAAAKCDMELIRKQAWPPLGLLRVIFYTAVVLCGLGVLVTYWRLMY